MNTYTNTAVLYPANPRPWQHQSAAYIAKFLTTAAGKTGSITKDALAWMARLARMYSAAKSHAFRSSYDDPGLAHWPDRYLADIGMSPSDIARLKWRHHDGVGATGGIHYVL